MSSMHYLVTGGAGFIGSNIVEELLKRGNRVRVIDNYATGRIENLRKYINDVELIEGDIRDYDAVKNVTQGVDIILHQAALPSVPRSIVDPITTNDVNVGGTLNVLKAALDEGVQRVVYASSSSVYGDNPVLPKQEDMIPNPLSPYAVSKLAGEKYCVVFSKVYGLETVSLRYFNVFGPMQDPNSQYSAVIPKFIKAMMNDERPTIYGDGEQSRDFTHVANVVEANILAATVPCEPGLAMNCACHGQITLNELVKRLNIVLDKDIKPIYKRERPGDIKHSFASISLINGALQYMTIKNFLDGVAETVKWYQNTRQGLEG